MPVKSIGVFLSCSFSDLDRAVNALIGGVCKGLHLACVNVGAGFTATPPDQAREFIASAEGLIAVATVRDRLDTGEFMMPSAVREEIAMAHALNKPILIVGEAGVRFDGFMPNYCTRLPFTRNDLTESLFIEKLVDTLFTFRQEITERTMTPPNCATEYVSESTQNLVSLEHDAEGYLWIVATKKRLRFEAPLGREIISIVWPAVPSNDTGSSCLPEWEVSIDAASRQFEVQPVVRDIHPDRIELALRFQPEPQPGDLIEFTRTFRSRRFNPLSSKDLPVGAAPAIVISGRSYPIRDGILITERVRKLHARYSFAMEYGLRPESVAAFVASHGYSLEYLAPWELRRTSVDIGSFGKKLLVDLKVEDPIPRYLYGIAWLPPD